MPLGGDLKSLVSGLKSCENAPLAVNRDPRLRSKLSRLRHIEMSSHRMREEEGQESLRNVNEAALRKGRRRNAEV